MTILQLKSYIAHIYQIFKTIYKNKKIMCLVINRRRHLRLKPKIARKNIPCYKILHIRETYDERSWEIVTPTTGTVVFSYQSTETKYLVADHFEEHPQKNPLEGLVIYHAIHSYRKINMVHTVRGEIIVCAYIPKGTKYWIGKYDELASERICFVL